MLSYALRRIVWSLPLLLLVTVVSFTVITLPPGDYMTSVQSELTQRAGLTLDEAQQMAEQLRQTYGLDKPVYVQYLVWLGGMFQGDLGYSFRFNKPVLEVIWVRLGWTFLMAFTAYAFSLVFGLLPGIYSATHQYGPADNILTVLSFLGLSTPSFFLALVLMYVSVFYLGATSVGGLYSPEMVMQPMSWAKFVDFMQHFWMPVVVIGAAGTARNMRVMRANLLDVLRQPFMRTARSKGLRERKVIYKHALRNAIQPIIMYFGMSLPWLIQGAMVTSVVLNLPTTGRVFLDAVLEQDMFLAGGFLLMIAIATILGNVIADLLLAVLDPRIRYE